MRLTAALQLVRTAGLAPLCDASDAELLRRFCRDRDETAFREILRRYETLVRGASRRLTQDRHAVDDAVQATFLELVRKAHAIRHAEALPAWLYRVARSVTARETAAVPVGAEPADPAPSPLDQLTAREVLAIFDEELDRLPAAHRSAVLLCTVEGSTVEDAARRLGTTPGAVRGWLQRGRDLLRRRLGARGVGLSVALALLVLDATAGTAGPVRDAIVRSAMASHRPAPAAVRLLVGSSAVWTASVGVLVAGVVAVLVLLSSGAGDPPSVPALKADVKADVKAEAKADTPVTRDKLPEGAVARIGSPRLRHGGEVVAVAFSPDGRFLATAAPGRWDKSVRVWDLADGKEKYRIPIAANPHEYHYRYRTVAVAFSADGKRLLVLDVHEFRSFDAATGRQEVAKVLSVKTDPNEYFPAKGIIGTGFSPDAKTFAVVRRNGEMLLGATATGEVKRTIAKSNVPENSRYSHVNILFTPTGSEVCIPVSGEPVPLFDTTTGESNRSLAKGLVPEYGGSNAAFASDGRTFVTTVATVRGGQTPTLAISIGDVATGKSLRTIPLPAAPRVLSISPNGKLLTVSTDSLKSSEVRVLDLESGKELQSVPLLGLTPALVAFSPDSRLLAATCHYEGGVTVWDIEKNTRHPQSADSTLCARFDPRGNVELNMFTRPVTIDWRTGKVLEDKAPKPGPAFSHARSEDGKVYAELDDESGGTLAVLVKESATGRTVARLKGVSDYPRRMAFADQNRLLVTVTQDEVLTVWDVEAGKRLWSEKYPARAFGYRGKGEPRFDAASRRMAITSRTENGTVIDVWELRRQIRVARVAIPRGLSGGIAFSPDGAFVAGGNEAVTCWRVSDGREVHTLRGHVAKESPNEDTSISCEFSSDGRKLLTVDGAGTIRVWEVLTGQVIRTFAGHNGPTTAHFSPDDHSIVGASYDAPVLIWDVYGLGAPPRFDADRVWKDLADASPAAAFRAVRELCAYPKEAVALLREKLKPESIDSKAIDGWVKDLSAEEFATRERATAELEKQGETIASLLRAAREAATDAETRQRLAVILRRMERLSLADLRIRRALDALEHLGTLEAKAYLEILGRGSPGCLRTVQAKEALSRISGR